MQDKQPLMVHLTLKPGQGEYMTYQAVLKKKDHKLSTKETESKQKLRSQQEFQNGLGTFKREMIPLRISFMKHKDGDCGD